MMNILTPFHRKRESRVDDHSIPNEDPTYSSAEEVRASAHEPADVTDDMYV